MAKGEQGIVQADGKTDGEDLSKYFCIHPLRKNGKADIRIPYLDVYYTENPGNKHGNSRGNCNSGHTHMEHGYQEQIQADIGQTGDNQKIQRCGTVPDSPENSGIHVITDISRCGNQNNSGVNQCMPPNILRHLHDTKQEGRCEVSDDTDGNSAEVNNRHCGFTGIFDSFSIVCSRKLGHQNADSRSDAEKNTKQYFDGLGTGSYSRKSRMVAIIADYQRVHGGI